MAENESVEQGNNEVLPSDAEASESSPFQSEYLSENVKDGKLFGKFESIDDLAKNYRELEVSHTNKMREYKEAERNQQQTAEQEVEAQNAIQQQQQVLQSLIPEFMQNNMELTDNIRTTLKEKAGYTDEQIELNAYRLKDSINQVHSYADGRENYEAAINWYRQRDVSDVEKAAFDEALVNPQFSRLTVKGLMADYKEATGATVSSQGDRLRGSNSVTTVSKGYSDRATMFKDRDAAMKSPVGSKMRSDFDAKMAQTDQKIIYGR